MADLAPQNSTLDSTDSTYVWHEQWDAGRIIKASWVMIQCTLMVTYSALGWKAYNKVQIGWSWTKTLFVFQDVVIVYLAVWTLTPQVIKGFYVILCCASYQMFCTSLIVIDACKTDEQRANKWRGLQAVNSIFRLLINLFFWGLMVSTFWMPSCQESVYPWNFLALSALILFIQIYNLFLWRHNYLLDYDSMPKISWNRLNYNKGLTQHQLKILQITFFVFGFCTLVTVGMGSKIVKSVKNDGNDNWLLCADWQEWATGGIWGGLFVGFHQMLILLQINAAQYVLIRAPRNDKVFEQDLVKQFEFHLGSRQNVNKILSQSKNHHEESAADEKTPLTLGAVLSEIKRAQTQIELKNQLTNKLQANHVELTGTTIQTAPDMQDNEQGADNKSQ